MKTTATSAHPSPTSPPKAGPRPPTKSTPQSSRGSDKSAKTIPARSSVTFVTVSRLSEGDISVSTANPTHRAHLTIAELCAELGVARSTFYDWRAAKKAPRCIKLPNGELRIRRTDLENWLDSLQVAA
ncbi:hypothetical protein GCM10009534_41080 [Kribbella sandramycini]